MAANLREQVMTKLNRLDEAQLANILRYIEVMQADELPDNYDPDSDPTIGLISGPTDLAERTEEILWAEFARPDTQENNKA